MRYLIAIVCALALVPVAAAKEKTPADGFGSYVYSLDVTAVNPDGSAVEPASGAADLGDGVTGGGTGCWRASARVGDNTSTGSYWLYFQPYWCGDYPTYQYITAVGDLRHFPYVSGWYGFAGDDGAWVTGGGVWQQYVTVRAQGRFSWNTPIGYTSNNTAWIELWLAPAGGAFLVSSNG